MNKKDKEKYKEIFRQWGISLDICNDKQKEIKKIRNMIKNISKGEEKVSMAIENTIRLYEKEIKNLHNDIESNIVNRRETEEKIKNLSPLEQKIIRLRYNDGYDWNGVATRAYISERQAYKIYSKAIEKLIEGD